MDFGGKIFHQDGVSVVEANDYLNFPIKTGTHNLETMIAFKLEKTIDFLF